MKSSSRRRPSRCVMPCHNWIKCTVSDCAEVRSGGTPATGNPRFWNGGIPWVTPSEVSKAGKYLEATVSSISKEGLDNSSAELLPINTVVMCSRATIGPRAILKVPMTTNQGFKNFICKENLDPEFWYYYLDVVVPSFLSCASGNTFKEVSKSDVEKTVIQLPSLSEQRRLTAILSASDRVVESKQKLLDSKKRQKRALMRRLLEPNSGDVSDSRIKRTQWQAQKLGKLGYFVSGTGFPLSYQGCSTGDFPFFKVSDMNRIGNETFLVKTDNWISDATRKSLSAIAIPQDAIAFAKVGAACLLERKRRLARASCLDNNMMAFVLESKDIDPAFMYLAFCFIRLSSSANLGTLPSINASSLKERVVMVPPKSIQERIVAVLSAADREIDGLAREINAWKEKRKALSQLLLSGKVRV